MQVKVTFVGLFQAPFPEGSMPTADEFDRAARRLTFSGVYLGGAGCCPAVGDALILPFVHGNHQTEIVLLVETRTFNPKKDWDWVALSCRMVMKPKVLTLSRGQISENASESADFIRWECDGSHSVPDGYPELSESARRVVLGGGPAPESEERKLERYNSGRGE